MKNIIVTGGSSGLGKCIVEALSENHRVSSLSNRPIEHFDELCDVSDYQSVKNKAKDFDDVDIIINCAGINKIDYLEDVEPWDFDNLINTNAKSIYNMSRAFLPQLIQSEGMIINITSNAAHMPMTSSLAYNASKAAAEIMTKQLARELFPRHGIKVFGIAPNKLSGTGMSEYIDNRVPAIRGWTFQEAKRYQLKGLALGEETPPEAIADFIDWMITTDNAKWFHGCIVPFGL